MGVGRVNLTLEQPLLDLLRRDRHSFNWSAVAAAALWRAVRGEPVELEVVRLTEENRRLRARLERVRHLAQRIFDT